MHGHGRVSRYAYHDTDWRVSRPVSPSVRTCVRQLQAGRNRLRIACTSDARWQDDVIHPPTHMLTHPLTC